MIVDAKLDLKLTGHNSDNSRAWLSRSSIKKRTLRGLPAHRTEIAALVL